MNVKELILSQPAADIATALLDRLDVEPAKRDKGIRRITALIDTLRGMKPEATDYRLLGVYHMYEDKEFLDANLYCKSELPAELAPLPDVLAVKGIDELTVDETEQAARAIQNMKAVLAAAGATPEQVVKTTVFLTDMPDFQAVNSVYAETFKSDAPARSCVAVASLPKGARVEIEAVAVL